MAVTATKRKPDDLTKLVRRVLRSRELAKQHYQRADQLLAEIASKVQPGDSIDLGSGKKAVLLDNWAGKSIVWGHGACRKWDIEIVAA